MNKLKKLYFLVFILCFYGCNSNNYEYWDLSQFHLDNNALIDGEYVTLLYASGGPDYKMEDYYVHFIVVSDSTGDTVNILSNFSVDITFLAEQEGDLIYFNEKSCRFLTLTRFF